jgi:hypothetical protein
MKVLFEDYTFNAAAKQIAFNTTQPIELSQLLVITNVTDNLIIYNFADPAAGGTISNNTLTLDYNTTSMSDTDTLQIFLDNTETPASDEMIRLLGRVVKLLEPSAVQSAGGLQRIIIDGGVVGQVATVTGVTAVTNLTNYNGYSTLESEFNLQSRVAYQLLRQNLEFS